MGRKRCARCGEESFPLEWSCWACGQPFVAPADAPTAMPAPVGGGRVRAVALGLALLLGGVLIGYWLGRAGPGNEASHGPAATDLPLVPAPLPTAAQPSVPVQLPPPVIRRLTPIPDPWRHSVSPQVWPPSWPGLGNPAGVTPFPASPWFPASPPPVGFPSAARVPRAVVPPSVRPGAPGSFWTLEAARAASASASWASPREARVRVHNRSPVALQMAMRGPLMQEARIAPGAEIVFPLPPGDYRVTLVARGHADGLLTVTLRAGKECRISFDAAGARIDGP